MIDGVSGESRRRGSIVGVVRVDDDVVSFMTMRVVVEEGGEDVVEEDVAEQEQASQFLEDLLFLLGCLA